MWCQLSFEWIVADYRYKSTYDQYSGVTTLTIYNLRDEDEGEYMCKAINSLGEATTSATLLSQGTYTTAAIRPRTRNCLIWTIKVFSYINICLPYQYRLR